MLGALILWLALDALALGTVYGTGWVLARLWRRLRRPTSPAVDARTSPWK